MYHIYAFGHFDCLITSIGMAIFLWSLHQNLIMCFNLFKFKYKECCGGLLCAVIKYCNKIYSHFAPFPIIDRHICAFYSCHLYFFKSQFRKLSKPSIHRSQPISVIFKRKNVSYCLQFIHVIWIKFIAYNKSCREMVECACACEFGV